MKSEWQCNNYPKNSSTSEPQRTYSLVSFSLVCFLFWWWIHIKQQLSLELHIRGGIKDNSKIICSYISQWKHMLWHLIRSVLARQFLWWVTTYVLRELYGKLSLNYSPFTAYLERCCHCRALLPSTLFKDVITSRHPSLHKCHGGRQLGPAAQN